MLYGQPEDLSLSLYICIVIGMYLYFDLQICKTDPLVVHTAHQHHSENIPVFHIHSGSQWRVCLGGIYTKSACNSWLAYSGLENPCSVPHFIHTNALLPEMQVAPLLSPSEHQITRGTSSPPVTSSSLLCVCVCVCVCVSPSLRRLRIPCSQI